MNETISVAIYETHGKPADVLQIRELPRPHAGRKRSGGGNARGTDQSR